MTVVGNNRIKQNRYLSVKKSFFLISLISFLIGCSPVFRYKVESFFFDDVPNPSQQILVTGKDSLYKSDTIHNKTIASKEMRPEFFFHPPYRDKKCSSCHESNFSNSLMKPLPDLCFTCHDDFSNKYQTLHGPVASGYCTACHNQHVAKYEKLLLRSGQQLCLYCHNIKQVFKNKIHEHVGEKNCTDCHSPHGGDNRGMLKPGSCYNCHEDFSTKYNFLHGPAAGGYCTACHSSHSSDSKNLLLRESQQLCFYCHGSKQVLKNAAHKNIKKSDCTECHNPHGGKDRYIINN